MSCVFLKLLVVCAIFLFLLLLCGIHQCIGFAYDLIQLAWSVVVKHADYAAD